MKKLIWVIVIAIIIIGGWSLIKKEKVEAPTTGDEATTEGENKIPDGVMMEDGTILEGTETNATDEELADDSAMIKNEIVTVTYTSTGFSPKDIEIAVGQTVRFVNQANANMWVASAVHPTHEVFPEFDQKEAVPSGGVYEFTFTKAGTWKYHNHVGASKTGTITVK